MKLHLVSPIVSGLFNIHAYLYLLSVLFLYFYVALFVEKDKATTNTHKGQVQAYQPLNIICRV